MTYRFLKGVANDFSRFAENTAKGRSYFVPFSSRAVCESGDYFKARYYSDRIKVLSGEWDFCYLPDGIIKEDEAGFDCDKAEFSQIKVPCSWENAGICDKKYLSGYEFPVKPFKVPDGKGKGNSLGIYRKKFNVSDFTKSYNLVFMKAGGAFEVHLNGVYVGFSSLGRGEFEVTKYLKEGENELVVAVKKWTLGSYLQGGSGFSATGITGDVYLVNNNPNALSDYSYTCEEEEDGNYLAKFSFDFVTDGNGADLDLKLELDGKECHSVVLPIEGNHAEWEIKDTFIPFLAENPVVYDLFIGIVENGKTTECTQVKVTFGAWTEMDGLVTWGGLPLKIRGVNYNACYSSRGTDMSFNDFVRDFELIKDYGFNAIQPTYALDPAIIHLAATKGLYIIDRIGVSTAGMTAKGAKKRDLVANDTKFQKAIEESALNAVQRDKAAPGVVAFTFGDENGASANISNAISKAKEVTQKTILARNMVTPDNRHGISSIFFPGVDGLIDEINRVSASLPVYLSEYALSSGIGSANLAEFNEIIENTSCCFGGSISYFVDDIVDGTGYCDNGLFSLARQPYAGALSHKFVTRPVRVRLNGFDKLEVYNSSYFKDTSDVEITLVMVKNSRTVSRVGLEVNVAPRESREMDVFIDNADKETYLNVECRDKRSGKLISVEQHTVHSELQTVVPYQGGVIDYKENASYIDLKFSGGQIRFSKYTGTIISYVLMDKPILYAAPERMGGMCFNTHITKPFVRNFLADNPRIEYALSDISVQNITKTSADVIVETVIKIKKKPCYVVQDKYTVFSNGVIEVFSVLNPYKKCPKTMDCFGKQLRFYPNFDMITYYGRGAGDNYIDMCAHANVGLYHDSVADMSAACAFGQECGNRVDVHYAVIKDRDGDGLMVAAAQTPFQLGVATNSDYELAESFKEKRPLAKSGVYIDVDAFVSGYGSGSCIHPMAKYTVKSAEHVLHFKVVPVYSKKEV